jgi:DNA-directed RNA polymerase specialized sigma24 family protein
MPDSVPHTSHEERRVFPHTRWSVVVATRRSVDADAALEILCRDYWYPLYAFARRAGQSPHDAQDLTQEFFRQLLEKRWLDAADRDKGRLRTFLITALKHFMAKEWRRECAQKRGGAGIHLPIDTAFAEGRFSAEAANSLPAETAYDRQWAMTLLEITMRRLEAEFAEAGKSSEFSVLKTSLAANRDRLDYASIAAGLGTNEGAARVAVHRLRKRFRELYREEIAQTLPDDADLDGELRHLAAALANG